MDDTQLVARELGIERATDVVILDPTALELVFRGALNDRWAEDAGRDGLQFIMQLTHSASFWQTRPSPPNRPHRKATRSLWQLLKAFRQ